MRSPCRSPSRPIAIPQFPISPFCLTGNQPNPTSSTGCYASGKGHALIDRELYLPKEWAEDLARRKAAGIPKEVAFATKPELARRMLARAIAAEVPFAWVLGDEVYGSDRRLRLDLEQQQRPFVLAIRSNEKP